MQNLSIVHKVKECNLTADQWELFTDTMKCGNVARTLNATFKRLVNSGMSRVEVYHHMSKVMEEYSDYGAADSEPHYVLEDLLDTVFGDGRNNDYYSY